MNPILTAIFNYLTSIWGTLRIAFGVFNTDTMVACAQLLTVVFIIGVIDNLPNFFNRAKERVKRPKLKDDEDEDTEWVMVRRKK